NTRAATLDRVAYHQNNASPNDRVISVDITDTAELTADNYVLRLSGGAASVYELLDTNGNTVQTGAIEEFLPQSIEYKGIRVNLESGNFTPGDEFLIKPTHRGGQDIGLTGIKANGLAFAQPIVTGTAAGNTGSGTISRGNIVNVLDPATGERLPTFAEEGSLAPPLLIKFTSETSYDVLDNTDPANPVSLKPPLENLAYSPGISNEILPDNSGQTFAVSNGFNAGRTPFSHEVVTGAVGTEASNAIVEELITIHKNLGEGVVESQKIVIPAGHSAQAAAAILSEADGISATASTYTEIKINDNGLGTDFELYLNGKHLTLSQPNLLGALPSPITNDYIAEAINIDGNLQAQGIRAVSDGDSIKIFSSFGADLKFQVEGGGGDNVQFKGKEPAIALGTVDLNNPVNFNS
ncbi:MAG: hypothetical protein OIF38_11175, partial [Cellvibrionaceae bacterium]|nr:hypothetical protein [Cellvibrionaceae bacterium]